MVGSSVNCDLVSLLMPFLIFNLVELGSIRNVVVEDLTRLLVEVLH